MPSASAAQGLYLDGDVVRCGEPVGRRRCKKAVLKGGSTVCDNGHQHSLAELIVAAKRTGLTIDELLRQVYEIELSDPFALHREIPGLLVMGPEGDEQAFLRPDDKENPNPLGLPEGWARLLAPKVPISADQLYEQWVLPSQTPEWSDQPDGCTPVLRLILREIPCQGGPRPTSPVELYGWFGRRHNNYGPGIVRTDIHYSNWYLGRTTEDWVNAPAVLQAEWQMSFLPHPAWTTMKTWELQQKAVRKRLGLRLPFGPEELWMMDILAACGQRFRENTWTRTSTIYDGCPLGVNLTPDGVNLYRSWHPGHAYPGVGAAVAGVLAA